MKLDQFTQFRFNSLTDEERWNRIEEYIQYQDDLWDDPLPSMNISSISDAMQPTFRVRLKRACNRISYLKTPTREARLKNPYLIYDYCGRSHKAEECRQNNPAEQVCLSGGDIYDDPSLLRFYQNDDVPPWGNKKRKEKREDGLEWVVRSKFEDELANFMLEKKFHTKGIGETLDQHSKEMHEQFSQILSTIGESKIPNPEAPTFTITTRSGVSTQDPLSRLHHNQHIPTTLKGQMKKKDLRVQNQALYMMKKPPGHPFSTNLPSHQICLSPPETLAVKKAMADLGASINLMPHSLFRRLGISKLKPTTMSIQLADRSIKYPTRVCENLLVKVNKFIFLIDFVVLEMDEDELVPIILR
ncbi:RNA-directed DNA polymerase [Tanacetum coccineum]|uniref:RNA-directed DNA polymerase n=1 Tax=Tanacetum coccineum TaxID=301880 RepID=A0ABQ5GTY3_9ASTR